jgi:hypothetical protein
MRLPLLVGILLAAGLLAGGFYSARPPARTEVPDIELPVVRERAQPERERPSRMNREPTGAQERNGGSGGGDGSGGATPVPAPAPTPAGDDDDDEDDDDADGDDASGDGDGGDD